jgi:cytochrome c oxidase cbb3-type subunit 3
MTSPWSWFVILLVAINILGSVWLLVINAKASPGETTGHVWDEDLTEYNKPLPMWWVGLFVITIVFGAGYLAFYPGLGNTAGISGWTSVKEHDAEVAATNAKLDALFAQYRNSSIADLVNDPKALAIGHGVFANNCAACHGSAARGAPGYPNLTDNDWLFGGDPETVVKTITDGRTGTMPPWGAVLGDEGVENVANYVLQLSNQKFDAAKADAGKAKYMTLCIACHGPDGKGNKAIGAPNLTDDIWLYGGDLATIEATIRNGRSGQMPAWGALLGPDRIRLVAAWVLAQSQDKSALAAKPSEAKPAAAEPVAAPEKPADGSH